MASDSDDDFAASHLGNIDPVLSVTIPASTCKDVEAPHLEHLRQARLQFHRVTAKPAAPQSLRHVAHRMAGLGPSGVKAERDSAFQSFLSQASLLRSQSTAWLASAPLHVRQVLNAASPKGGHPALLHWCLQQIKWHDADLITDLLDGFPLVGHIPVDSSARLKTVRSPKLTVDELLDKVESLRSRALERHGLHADPETDGTIFTLTTDEVDLKRMSTPRPPHGRQLLTRRFGVWQTDSKGRLKLRCIDDFAESLINDTTLIDRAIRMGRVSDLVDVISILESTSRDLRLLKSDFSAAYRGCPIKTSHLRFASVLVRDASGTLHQTRLRAMPFGAVAAVYAWDRLGGAIQAILQRMFLIPCSRYVDDLFWADFSDCSDQGRQMALDVVSHLGFTLAVDKTPPASDCQEVLGIQIRLQERSGALSVDVQVEPRKLQLWALNISEVVKLGRMDFKSAEKLIGRLSFAAWAIWGPPAWARLRGLHSFLQQGAGIITPEVIADFTWWQQRLVASQSLEIIPRSFMSEPYVIYTDAEGSSGVGIVICTPSVSRWVGCRVPEAVSKLLMSRTTQIFAYETLAVWAALHIFGRQLQDRQVLFFIDNTSSLASVRKGSTRSPDVHTIIGAIWDILAKFGIKATFRWVPSKLNLSDPPSRDKPPAVGSQLPSRISWQTIITVLQSGPHNRR